MKSNSKTLKIKSTLSVSRRKMQKSISMTLKPDTTCVKRGTICSLKGELRGSQIHFSKTKRKRTFSLKYCT
jgi:hypothetical protein